MQPCENEDPGNFQKKELAHYRVCQTTAWSICVFCGCIAPVAVTNGLSQKATFGCFHTEVLLWFHGQAGIDYFGASTWHCLLTVRFLGFPKYLQVFPRLMCCMDGKVCVLYVLPTSMPFFLATVLCGCHPILLCQENRKKKSVIAIC